MRVQKQGRDKEEKKDKNKEKGWKSKRECDRQRGKSRRGREGKREKDIRKREREVRTRPLLTIMDDLMMLFAFITASILFGSLAFSFSKKSAVIISTPTKFSASDPSNPKHIQLHILSDS